MADLGGGGLFNLEATLKLDTSQYASEIRSAASSAESLASTLEGIDASISVDTSELDSASGDVKTLEKDITDLHGVTADVNVNANADEAVEDLTEVDTAMEEIDDEKHADVDVDAEDAITDLDEVTDELHDIQDVDADVDVEFVGETAEDVGEVVGALHDITDVDADVSVETGTSAEDAEEVSGALDAIEETKDVIVSADTGTSVDDIGDVSDAIGDIDSSSVTASLGIEGIVSTITESLGSMTVFGVIQKVSTAIAGLAGDIAASGDKVDKQSQILGISRKAYQEWAYVLSQNGTSMDASASAFRSLTKNFENGTEDFQSSIAALGLSYESVAAMSGDDRFAAIVAAFQNMEDGVEKNALAMEVFGTRATALMPLLNGTADGTQELIDTANDLGMVMSDEDIDAAVHYTDALDTLNRAIDGLKNNLADVLLPALTDAMTALSNFIGLFTSEDLESRITSIGTAYATSIGEINATELNAYGIIDQLEQLSQVEAMTPEQVARWGELTAQLESIMPGIGRLFSDQAGQISGGAQALRDYVSNLSEAARVQAYYLATEEERTALADAYKEMYRLQAEADAADAMADQYVQQRAENMQTLAEMYGITGEAYENYLKLYQGENGEIDYATAAEHLYSNNVPYEFQHDPFKSESAEDVAAMNLVDSVSGSIETLRADAEAARAALAEQEGVVAELEATTTMRMKSYAQIAGLDFDETTGSITALGEATEVTIGAMDELADSGSEPAEELADASGEVDNFTDAMDSAGDSVDFSSKARSAMSKTSSAVSTGLSKVVSQARSAINTYNSLVSSMKSGSVTFTVTTSTGGGGSGISTPQERAVGLDYVPYNDYPALLHEGEAVLTKLEAKSWRAGSSGDGISGEAIGAMANVIASAVASRPIAFSVSGRSLATSTRDDASRVAASRAAQVQSGYGRGSR